MRVGRAALDENAIRLIEDHNRDVQFDWTRILKGEAAPPESKPRQDGQERRPPRQRTAPPPVVEPLPPAPSPEIQPHAVEVPAPPGESPRIEIAPVPAFDDDGTPTDAMADERAAGSEAPVTTAALSRLGPEGLLRLRARHAEVLARISEKVTDPAGRDELKTQAERLNPDTWVTDTEVTAGLEQYETVFESLRSVVGRRRKRRRRRGTGDDGTPDTGESGASAGEPDTDGGPGEDL